MVENILVEVELGGTLDTGPGQWEDGKWTKAVTERHASTTDIQPAR